MPQAAAGFIDSNRVRERGIQAASPEAGVIMSEAAAQALIQTIAIYLGCGAVFGVLFLWRWVGRLDTAAAHGTIGFRALVFPGVAALWPLFLVRLVRR
jgi:hypothetical protein